MDSGDTGRAGAGCALIICQYIGKCGFFFVPHKPPTHKRSQKKKKRQCITIGEEKNTHKLGSERLGSSSLLSTPRIENRRG